MWDMIDQGLQLQPYCSKYGGAMEPGVGYGGDFGDIPNTRQFCINGLFGPQREPHPSAYEVKACMSPVTACLVVGDENQHAEGEKGLAKKDSTGVDYPLSTLKKCFKDVEENKLRVRLTNRRSFASLEDLLVHVSFRCNLSSEKHLVHNDGQRSTAPQSIETYKFVVSGGSVQPNGGYVDIDLAEAFESIYLKSKGSVEATLGAPLEEDTPSALSPYVHSSSIGEVWVQVTVDVKDEHSTRYVPSQHLVYQKSLPHTLLLDAVKTLADSKVAE